MLHSLRRASLLLCFLLIVAFKSIAQTPPQTYTYSPLYDNLNPVTPTSWQFVKYDELPVSEYTGLPNVSIPLYEIDQDDIKLPLNLTYHAGGIHVNEDASWVGLGWDLQVGSIIQTVSDNDDLAQNTDGSDKYTKVLPDFYGGGPPAEYPMRYNYPLTSDGPGWTATTPIQAPQYNATYMIATDAFLPVNGNFDTRQEDLFITPQYYDTEPDIFKANFFGYSVNFVVNWASVNQSLSGYSSHGQFVVLNHKGYKVTYDSNGFHITVPNGDTYTFQLKTSVYTTSITTAPLAGYYSPITPTTKVFMLTGITTKNQQQITFNYTTSSGTYSNFPNFSQSYYAPTLVGSFVYQYCGNYESFGPFRAYGHMDPISGYGVTTTTTKEQRTYLSSIVFPKGQVNFIISPTSDILGGQKLDSIAVVSNQLIKSYKFNYTYFNTSATGGHQWVTDTTTYHNTASLRLKLLSVKDISGGVYSFTYNSTPLPNKGCCAQDYWGYYNGQLSDTTLIPNPVQFKISGLSDNGENHSANASYTGAANLQQVKYPTGGTVNFGYELNNFDNYWVPDFSSNANTVSHGNGLRIHSVIYDQADGTQSKEDLYTYSIGKSILPMYFFRNYNFYPVRYLNACPDGVGTQVDEFNMNQVTSAGYYSSSPFSSVTGVGYDTVSHQQVDVSGNTSGTTKTIYYNLPDNVSVSINEGSCQLSESLVALKNINSPENGSVKSVLAYNAHNTLLKKVANTYSNTQSDLFYGSRISGYVNYFFWNVPLGVGGHYDFVLQNLIGFYPIYDFETLLTNSVQTDYFGPDSVTTTTRNTYDGADQLSSTTSTNSTYQVTSTFSYPYTYHGLPGDLPVLDSMTAHNRLTDIVNYSKNSPNAHSTFSRQYTQSGQLFLANEDIERPMATSELTTNPNITTYDLYDLSNGNMLQYSQNTVPTSLLWDYNKQYVTAMAKNVVYSNIAYTSFEADGTGRWKFTGAATPDPAAPSGGKVTALPMAIFTATA